MKRIWAAGWLLVAVFIGLAVSAGPRPAYAQDGGPVCESDDFGMTCGKGFSGCTQNCGEDAVEGSKRTCTPGPEFRINLREKQKG